MIEECGVRRVMDVFGGKWKVNILWAICKREGIRFNQLRREVKGITNVMLTRSLETLIEKNLVARKDFQTIPPHVEYYLTDKGRELVPFMQALDAWGRENL
ncbi:winged helix-turn-helix transcriptional regulator [Lactococcus protaetiae]|uniref:Helix-turn-helix transcriptional regulator n=1 Tax=Lactococcus protaetiae TaxID=2592653 RepID=A0A514ZAT8_9LACT|nr:helix-turn-helix domain-containing protein [Lactococcus protaetiae]QDK71685.1 helix-turn-helix transcriptional regulator [Lactococcus protaetiae]